MNSSIQNPGEEKPAEQLRETSGNREGYLGPGGDSALQK